VIYQERDEKEGGGFAKGAALRSDRETQLRPIEGVARKGFLVFEDESVSERRARLTTTTARPRARRNLRVVAKNAIFAMEDSYSREGKFEAVSTTWVPRLTASSKK